MKLTEEELKHYYASRGIVATDLLSTDAIDLSELPPDAELREPNRSIALNILGCWNGLDPLSKIDSLIAANSGVYARIQRVG